MTTSNFDHQLTSLQDNLRYFATSLTQDEDDANDLVQETYLKALTYRDKFEANTNLKAWTFTIMKNTFINNYRKNAKVSMVMDNTEDLYFLNSNRSSDDSNPDSVLSFKDISKVVNNLEDEHRLPFEMHHTGFKYHEIAEELDLPIGTVKSRIFFSRKKLMDSLKDHV